MKQMSELLESIKMDLGIYGLSLPIENVDEQLMNVIRLRTIKTFSQYFPYVMDVSVNLTKLETAPDTNNYDRRVYLLPQSVAGNQRIISIHNVSQKPVGMGYGPPSSFGACPSSIENFILAQAQVNLASSMAPPQTFEYIQPNKLIMYNQFMYASDVILRIAYEHYENLATIPYTAWESFESLALLDVKRFLYGIMKHYTEIQTAHGTINLKIDDWQNAEQERQELVTQWRQNHHLDGPAVFVI